MRDPTHLIITATERLLVKFAKIKCAQNIVVIQ